jgi:four helix bundle protein
MVIAPTDQRLDWFMPNTESATHAFERLQAWAACHELALALYRESATWPAVERYGITAQIRSAAVSSAANIAEGSARRGAREFKRCLDISLGSLAELAYYLKLARDLGLLPPDRFTALEISRDHASRVTWGLAIAIGKRAGSRDREPAKTSRPSEV